jgi:hypothetical protein
MRLASRVLALTSRKDLAENCFRNFIFGDACALYDGFQNSSTKVVSRSIGKRASKRTNCRTSSGGDYNISHEHSFPRKDLATVAA